MHRSHRSTLSLHIVSLLVPLAILTGLMPGRPAEAQKIKQAIAVAVVPFADATGRNSDFIAQKATDAAALALEDSQEYVVAPRDDTQREMQTLGIFRGESTRVPISEEQMVRLGERLRVEKVAHGSVDRLNIEKGTGRCRCVLTVRMLDVSTQAYLDGATADYTTQAIPGWKGDESEIINEALRSAAEVAIERMQTSRRPRGNVDIVDQAGEITINLGARDGMEMGMELLVVRGVWNAAQERVALRRVGTIAVKSIEVNMSRCYLQSGKMPRTGDKCYVMYRPTKSIAIAAKKAKAKNTATIGAALLLLAGIVSVATGPHAQSAPGVTAYLSQARPGAEPRARVTGKAGSIPGSAKTFAWLVYRGDYMGFPAEVDNANHLIHVERGPKLAYYEDSPERLVDINFTLTFQYFDEAGEQQDGDADITYNHLEMVAGQTYYYKLRRIIDPGRVDSPISSAQTTPDPPVDVDFSLDPSDALSDPSSPVGPITFFMPPTPDAPSNGSTAVDWRVNRTTFEWEPSTGADQYQVVIYNNPSATGSPAKRSPILTYLGESTRMRWTLNTNLEAGRTYYWFVGARRSGEVPPVCQGASGITGWVLGPMQSFTTVVTPPSPASAGAGGVQRPGANTGWWGEQRVRRP